MKSDELRTAVREIWSGVLGKAISSEQQFFQLGGDSLDAMRVIAAIERKFVISIDIEEFFSRPTVRDVAALITRALDEKKHQG